MGSKGKSKKQQVREYLAARESVAITKAEWDELLALVGPVSENYLREVLHETGLPFEQPYAGVRQKTFAELEESLLEMERIYSQAVASSDRELARYCRRQVIGAKDRARFVAGNAKTPPEKKALKEEMIQWLLVWLDNPAVFPAWVKLRVPRMSAKERE